MTAVKRSKAALRAEARRRRAAAARAAPQAGEALARRVLEAVPPPPGAAVSAYWPMGDELDCRTLLAALRERGHVIGLPIIVRKGEPLRFRAWQAGVALVPGGFGTSMPPEDAPAVVPDYLLVPLLCFDRAGYRLGYGGGFYDRTLEGLRRAAAAQVTAVGIAYAGQEVPEVPREPTDQRVDWIVTEAEAFRIP
jgi:5-formyltetrahydrofolate cyclo-ligase